MHTFPRIIARLRTSVRAATVAALLTGVAGSGCAGARATGVVLGTTAHAVASSGQAGRAFATPPAAPLIGAPSTAEDAADQRSLRMSFGIERPGR